MKLKKFHSFHPPEYDIRDVQALYALQKGEATPEQQIRAIKWIIEKASMKDNLAFLPDARETDFMLGRIFVGQQIVKLMKLNPNSKVFK